MYLLKYINAMQFSKLLHLVGDEPIFESALLFAGEADLPYLQRQLSRWVKLGYLHQMRRGLYALASPYRKAVPHPFLVANRLVRASYVSCESALSYHGLIPEYVPMTTSITSQRPGQWTNAYGTFHYQNVKVGLFFGYERVQLDQTQQAFVATPEKALIDLIHLRPAGDNAQFLHALRLQQLDRLDLARMQEYATRASSPKLLRACETIRTMVSVESADYETL
jgi:predicted transcriptional regulator of viral defense system